jgi:hypothetical protein
MNWLNRLSGFQRSAPGRESVLWRRLPAILGWGTALPAIAALVLWVFSPVDRSQTDDRLLMLFVYQLIGFVVVYWTFVFTLAIGCAIVMIMKGPAYVADRYPPAARGARDDH